MKEIIYNRDNLVESDINDIVVRVKVLLIKDGNILIGNESGVFQFVGGHLEMNESLEDALLREIREETGIDIELDNITKPFMKIVYLNKDYPSLGINRKNEIYYYAINTNKDIDMSKSALTDNEISKNYKIESINLSKIIHFLKSNINNKNEVIVRDMLFVLEEYLKES